MRTSSFAAAALACVAGLAGCQVPAVRAANAQAAAPAAQPTGGGEAMFQNLEKLVGTWQAMLPNNKPIVDTFQTFGAGNYVLHEEWVDGKQITSSVFYMVGAQLWVDHYCDYLNQPRYVAKPSADPAVIDLEFRGATNLDTHPRHFHSTIWHLVDATHMTQDWDVRGGPKGEVHVHLSFTRTGSSA
jgi:hypothetical protein